MISAKQREMAFAWAAVISLLAAGQCPAQQGSLATELKQTYGDIANLRNSSVQFLQKGGRWFPAPQGDDAEASAALRDLQEKVGNFKRDLDAGESMDTLKFDMKEANTSYSWVEAVLPKIGGSKEIAQDWHVLQNDMTGVRAAFETLASNDSGKPGDNSQHTPTVPELTHQLQAQITDCKASLGQFLTLPTRVPPPHEEDLMLVQSLKQFEQLLNKFSNEQDLGRPLNLLQEQEKQIRYTARKMDPLFDAVGADQSTTQKYQQLRDTVEQLHDIIGNNPQDSDSFYLDAKPANAGSPDAPEGSVPGGYGAPLPQDNSPGL